MTYYVSNAIYKALDRLDSHQFIWVSGNAWMLVYGDSAAVPRLLVLAHGESWDEQASSLATLEKIATASGLPAVRVVFDDQAQSITGVDYSASLTGPLTSLSLSDLKQAFGEFGLPVRSGICGKSVNDATSSAYHHWQRTNLGAIKVSDIDLVRIDEDDGPSEIIELKRSYYSLDQWRPFTNDYVNFNLLLRVAKGADVPLTIAYNVRHKNPFRDDASQLTLFAYERKDTPSALGRFDFDDFVAGTYL